MSANVVNKVVSQDLIMRLDEARNVAHFAEPVKWHPAREDDIDEHESLGYRVVDEDVAGNVVYALVAELKCLVGRAELVLVLEGLGWERSRQVSGQVELGKGVRMCDDGRVGVGCSDEGGSANVVCMRVAVDEMIDWKVRGVADGEENFPANCWRCVNEDYTRGRDNEEGLIDPLRDHKGAISEVFQSVAGCIERNTGC